MIFYVYLDPSVIPAAVNDGPYALQLLIAMLRGFLQNCLLVDFQDYQLQESLGQQVEAMPSNFDRKLIKSLLVAMSKRNRFVYCLVPDYTTEKSDRVLLMEQAATALIDLAVFAVQPPAAGLTIPAQLEVTTLATYQHSNFEPDRSRLASGGKRSIPGAMTAAAFLEFHFRKALRFAAKIELCDQALGKYYGDNYKYTIREFFQALEATLADPDSCVIDLHCEQPPGRKKLDIEGDLRAARRGRLVNLTIRVHYYDGSGLSGSLPHERFIRTQQIAISIDRGLDFLDPRTQTNRDVFMTLTDPQECDDVLSHFAGKRIGTPTTL